MPAVVLPFLIALSISEARGVAVTLWGQCVLELMVGAKAPVHTMHLLCVPPGEPEAACPAALLHAAPTLDPPLVQPLLLHGFNATITGHSSGDAFVVVTSSSSALTAFLGRQPRAETE